MNKDFVTREEFESLKRDVINIKRQLSFGGTKKMVKRDISKHEIFLSYDLANSDPDKCLVIMSILDNEKGEKGFNLADIKDVYKSVKEKLPEGISTVISRIKKRKYIETLSGKGKSRLYQLTNPGFTALEKLKNKEI